MYTNVDLSKCHFFCNGKDEIPQQGKGNDYDYGVYLCIYARCLALPPQIVDEQALILFRQCMLWELHPGELLKIPLPLIETEKYYAVHYKFHYNNSRYYIGRVLSFKGEMVKMKYLYRTGANRFDWPARDDVEEVHISCIFFGPIKLENAGPFTIPMLVDIEKVFS